MQSNEPDFKYTPPLSLGQSLKRDRSPPERPQSPVKLISDPHNYPRKRASIACEICRVRKTRCDGAKPGCVSCIKLGVACSYAKPASGNRSVLYCITLLFPQPHLKPISSPFQAHLKARLHHSIAAAHPPTNRLKTRARRRRALP